LRSGDTVLADTIAGPVFDRGFYRSIRIVSSKGETLVEKQLPPAPPDVPRWFTVVVNLQAPTAESLITSGWQQLGRVIVTSHPNFAYLQLWHTAIGFFYWLVAIYAVALILLQPFLRAILRPLREIEAVARAISNREFKVIEQIPKAPELRSVVDAMNSLSGKIRKIIDTEVDRANQFRHEAYTDPLTLLGNRRSFEVELATHLGEGPDILSGVIYMIELDNFKAFNVKHGFKDGDVLLQLVGKALAELGKDENKQNLWLRSRINGATFAVAAFGVTRGEAESLGSELCSAIAFSFAEQKLGQLVTFNCGGAYFGERPTMSALLAEADMAMLQARALGANNYALLAIDGHVEDAKGSQYWKRLILEAIVHNKFALLAQPVIRLDDNRRIQLEVVGRIEEEQGELIAAAQFMPMAVRHNLAAAIDMKLIELALDTLRDDKTLSGDIALNLSVRSINDAEFFDWLIATLNHASELARRLVFEVAEFGVARDLSAAGDFVTRLRLTGARFAVDNFGLDRLAFAYLQDLKPEYIKLNIALIGDLAHKREDQFFISSIVNITHILGIMTIANGVDSNDLLPLLKNLGVEAYQGYATGALTRIDR
jgi:diguanylate cyclase (GGDEF)-like protein